MRKLIAILVSWAVFTAAGRAAPFQNLDFESVTLPVIPYGQYGDFVPISEGLPGWSASLGTNGLTEVLHNSVTLGSPAVLIWGPDWPYGRGGRIDGDFTVALWGGFGPADLAISQMGIVPADSRWLLFNASVASAPPPLPTDQVLAVSLNDQDLPFAVLATYSDYSLYGTDISSFAGNEAELEFTVFGGHAGTVRLDSIVFSPVPEPGSLALLALGLGALACWRRMHSRPAP